MERATARRADHPKPASVVELLQVQAACLREERLYTFLVDGEREERTLSYAELDSAARRVASALSERVAAGSRALLLYPPGLEFVSSLFGCLYAGVLAVPAYPPDPLRPERTVPRLRAIAADASPAIVLSTTAGTQMSEALVGQLAPELARLPWLATDDLDGTALYEPRTASPSTPAILQYTSGSTASPKGVVISHGNILSNTAVICDRGSATSDDVYVCWLPNYHDMGLIGGLLVPLFGGFPSVLMSPLHFLQRPLRWLRAIADHRGTISPFPNFALDLCVRKITDEQRDKLDLTSWRVACNGAEPIRARTMEAFAERFAPCGFEPQAFYPCYGLAEATLIVSGGPTRRWPTGIAFDAEALSQGHVVEAQSEGSNAARLRHLVSCGWRLDDHEIAIVDPISLRTCGPNRVGEIWTRGPSVASGYWNRPDNGEVFGAWTSDTGQGPYLRTGDLGFLRDDELFVTGRRKEVILIAGRNLYPQDVESVVEQAHPACRQGGVVAFAVDGDRAEELVVVAEIAADASDLKEIVRRLIEALVAREEVRPAALVLVPPHSVPKTSSGKAQRLACRDQFLAGTLSVLHAWP